MTEYKKYEKLQKTFDYDREKAETYAEAASELIEVRKREKYLTNLLQENRELAPFVWTTLDGKTIALHKVDNGHLRNIMNHIIERGGVISPQIKAEALSRSIDVPDSRTTAQAFAYLNKGQEIAGEIIDLDDELED